MNEQLNKILATLGVFAQNQRGYHWNIVGKDFFDLHSFTEELYEYASESIDMVAERLRQLQQIPAHTLEMFLEHSAISSQKDVQDAEKVMATTLQELEAVIAQLKAGIEKADEADDDGTEDMLIEILREFEKKTWMTRAWLNK